MPYLQRHLAFRVLLVGALVCSNTRAVAGRLRAPSSTTRRRTTAVPDCGVVIAGGSVAAFAAAIASASENVTTCLLEPTDWVGGQMTANGVPALDFAPEGYPTQWGQTADTQPPNLGKRFSELLAAIGRPGFGRNSCSSPHSLRLCRRCCWWIVSTPTSAQTILPSSSS